MRFFFLGEHAPDRSSEDLGGEARASDGLTADNSPSASHGATNPSRMKRVLAGAKERAKVAGTNLREVSKKRGVERRQKLAKEIAGIEKTLSDYKVTFGSASEFVNLYRKKEKLESRQKREILLREARGISSRPRGGIMEEFSHWMRAGGNIAGELVSGRLFSETPKTEAELAVQEVFLSKDVQEERLMRAPDRQILNEWHEIFTNKETGEFEFIDFEEKADAKFVKPRGEFFEKLKSLVSGNDPMSQEFAAFLNTKRGAQMVNFLSRRAKGEAGLKISKLTTSKFDERRLRETLKRVEKLEKKLEAIDDSPYKKAWEGRIRFTVEKIQMALSRLDTSKDKAARDREFEKIDRRHHGDVGTAEFDYATACLAGLINGVILRNEEGRLNNPALERQTLEVAELVRQMGGNPQNDEISPLSPEVFDITANNSAARLAREYTSMWLDMPIVGRETAETALSMIKKECGALETNAPFSLEVGDTFDVRVSPGNPPGVFIQVPTEKKVTVRVFMKKFDEGLKKIRGHYGLSEEQTQRIRSALRFDEVTPTRDEMAPIIKNKFDSHFISKNIPPEPEDSEVPLALSYEGFRETISAHATFFVKDYAKARGQMTSAITAEGFYGADFGEVGFSELIRKIVRGSSYDIDGAIGLFIAGLAKGEGAFGNEGGAVRRRSPEEVFEAAVRIFKFKIFHEASDRAYPTETDKVDMMAQMLAWKAMQSTFEGTDMDGGAISTKLGMSHHALQTYAGLINDPKFNLILNGRFNIGDPEEAALMSEAHKKSTANVAGSGTATAQTDMDW